MRKRKAHPKVKNNYKEKTNKRHLYKNHSILLDYFLYSSFNHHTSKPNSITHSTFLDLFFLFSETTQYSF